MANVSPPEKPTDGFWNRLLGIVSGGLANIVELAGVVLRGEATLQQSIFFSMGVLAIMGVVLGVILAAFRGDPNFLLVIFGIMALVVVALMITATGAATGRHAEGGAPAAQTEERKKLEQELGRERAECVRLRKIVEGVMLTTSQIHAQISKQRRAPAVMYTERTLVIEADGTMRFIGRRTIKPVGSSMQMVDHGFSGDVALEHIEDLKVSVSSEVGRVVMLPAENKPSKKAVVFFFLPEIAADEERTYTYQWEWPRTWEPLIKNGIDSYSHTVHSATTVPLVRFVFKVHPSIPPVQLSNTGQGDGEVIKDLAPTDDHGYRQYGWQLTQVPSGTKIAIQLKGS